MKRFSIRVTRKLSRITNRIMSKGVSVSKRIDNKATRILDGTDFSMKLDSSVPLEKIYYGSLPYVLPLNPALPTVAQEPTVTLLLPSLDGKAFYGGTATALVVAASLAKLYGRKLKIVQTLKRGTPSSLGDFFAREGIKFDETSIIHQDVSDRRYDFYGYLSMHPDDIFIASAWWDAHLLDKLPLKHKFIYLVQDFEPIFYNNSDMSVLAESTYRMNSYLPLCNTRLMKEFMVERGYKAFHDKTLYFEPAVSRLSSGIAQRNLGKRRIFLYGRPDVHRNLFLTALEGLAACFANNQLVANEWEIVMAGQDNLPDIKLPSGVIVKNHGKLSMAEYVALSKTIDIAISPMLAPHPNYPTLEFASIGSMVVTTSYANKQSLDNYSPNIIVSEPEADKIAQAIICATQKSYENRVADLNNTHIGDNWTLALDTQLKHIKKSLRT